MASNDKRDNIDYQKTNRLPASKNRDLLGTPDYLAPELLLGLAHGPAVDWWALGVCMFEWLVGYPPFMDDSPAQIFRRILDHDVYWPEEDSDVGDVAKSVVMELLNMNVGERLKAAGMKKHVFYEGLDWAHLLESPAPFIPKPEDGTDTSYFDGK